MNANAVPCRLIAPTIVELFDGGALIYIDAQGEDAHVTVGIDLPVRQMSEVVAAVAALGYELLDIDECPPALPTPDTIRWWLAEKDPNA